MPTTITKPLGLMSIMETGKYSDLTLVCQGKEFPVHKAFVCSQSPVLAAACDGRFQEAPSEIVEVTQFDIRTVECMTQFMYKGDYDTSHATEEDLGVGTALSASVITYNLSDNESTTIMHTEKPEVSMATKLLPQVHIAAIAEYYGVSPLAENANAKIENMLKTNWSPRGFSDVVTTALQSTRDRGLRETLGVVIAEHFDQLVEDEDILEVMDVGLAVAER
ncbi:hypothetical protein ETB97_006422 [Aspergillus alliaceus]|uniref:BTB domain-containing protein n=1 Tax=Petromyces alliaceus TaxID=209559 RepID=A0A8H5ZXS6_PETAA|nr:hypothetical protein ETB97_006422 [Aspergillus burnettii]